MVLKSTPRKRLRVKELVSISAFLFVLLGNYTNSSTIIIQDRSESLELTAQLPQEPPATEPEEVMIAAQRAPASVASHSLEERASRSLKRNR